RDRVGGGEARGIRDAGAGRGIETAVRVVHVWRPARGRRLEQAKVAAVDGERGTVDGAGLLREIEELVVDRAVAHAVHEQPPARRRAAPPRPPRAPWGAGWGEGPPAGLRRPPPGPRAPRPRRCGPASRCTRPSPRPRPAPRARALRPGPRPRP